MALKGSKTEQNLLKSFAGESQARNRYTYFASAAKKEGFEQISAIFIETADNEKEHAKVFFKYLEGGDLEITAAYPAGSDRHDRREPARRRRGREDGVGHAVPGLRQRGRARGLPGCGSVVPRDREGRGRARAALSQAAGEREERHRLRKDGTVKWKCRNCGYVFEGADAPESVPACHHPRSFYELWVEAY